MIAVAPVTLEGFGVRLEPLGHGHESGLATAARDGELWKLWFTSVPEPADTAAYVDAAIEGQRAGHRHCRSGNMLAAIRSDRAQQVRRKFL